MAWWGKTIQSNVYATLDYKLKKQYPKLTSGTDYFKDSKDITFPYYRLYIADGKPTGQTFDGGVNAISQTYQFDVFSNDKESTCREIAEYAATVLSKYMTITQPVPTASDSSQYRYTFRASWLVGANNVLASSTDFEW